MNLEAICHKAVDNYCYPLNENDIKINIYTGYDVAKVTLVYGDPFTGGIMGGNQDFTESLLVLEDTKLLRHQIIWSGIVKPKFKRLSYYFILEAGKEKYYMLEDDFYTESEFKSFNRRKQFFYFPWMNPSDINVTPDWVNSTVWYQIFIDRFCNGNPDINPKNVKPWKGPDKQVKSFDFYGGDIPGITSKMDYLRSLGISGLYLTPVCKGESNHKYDTGSYTTIDPHFGTDEDMKEMVKTAHEHGIKVMMDGVFNHSGRTFKPWEDVVKNGPDSKYYDWFMINSWPFSNKGFATNSKAGKYYTFAFVDMMPKLNTNNPEVRKFILKVLTKWVKEYDIDGIRLDVANEISHTLCKEMRIALKKLKPDIYILGEIWHDSTPWLRGDEFDSVMNYPFGDSIEQFWTDKNSTALDFEFAINRCYSMYMEQTSKVLFNLLDSHDTIRLINKLGDIHSFYQQMAILFTMPGTVCIYYGTELVLEGGRDPDCRRCMPWKEIEQGKYDDRIKIMKKLISLRNKYPAFRSNQYKFIRSKNDRVIIYERYSKNCKTRTVIINCSDIPYKLTKDKTIFKYGKKENLLMPGGVVIY